MGKSAKLHSFWKATKELPEAWRAARSARKTYATASKTVRVKTKAHKRPTQSSTYREAKITKDESLTAWGKAGKRVAKGLVIPGGVAVAGAVGATVYRKK